MPNYGTAWIDVRGDTSGFLSDIQSATSKAGSLVSGVGRTVLGDLGRLGSQTATAVATASAAAATSLGKVGIEYNTLEQSSFAAYKTLLGTEDAARRMQEDLREFAKTSPFPRQAFIEGTQRLLAFGFEAKKVVPTLDAIQNAVAAAGGSASDLSEIVEVFAKIRSSGALTIRDLNVLGLRGINAAKAIGEQMGMTEAEFRDSLFGAPLRGAEAMEALDALVAGLSETYEGAAEGLKSTWVGAVDRIKGAWRDIGSDLAEPFVSKEGGGAGVEWANSIADSLRGLQKTVVPLLVPIVEESTGALADGAERAKDFVAALRPGDVAAEFTGVIRAIDRTRDSLKGAEGVAAGVGVAIAGIGARSVLGPLGLLVPAISPVTGALVGLVAGSRDGRDALRGMGERAKGFAMGPGQDLLRSLGTLADDLSGPVARAMEGVFGGLLDAGERVVPAVVRGVEMLGPPLGRLIDAGGKLAADVLPRLADVLDAGLSVALPIVGTGLDLAATAAGLLADNAWLVVPALSAIAAIKIVDSVKGLSGAFSGIGDVVGAIKGIAATRGVSTAAATLGVVRSSAGDLAGTFTGLLNPAVIGVGTVLTAGMFIWDNWKSKQDATRRSAEELVDMMGQLASEFDTDRLGKALRLFQESPTGNQRDALVVVNELGRSLSDLADFATKAGPDAFGSLRTNFSRLSAEFMAFGEDSERFQGMLNLLPDSVRDFGVELIKLGNNGDVSREQINHFLDAMVDMANDSSLSLDRAREKFIALGNEAATTGDITEGAWERISESIRNAETPEEMNVAVKELLDLLGAGGLADAMHAAALEIEDANDLLNNYGDEAKTAAEASEDAADGVTLTAESMEGLKASVDEAKIAIQQLLVELFELQGSERGVAAAERAQRSAMERLVEGAVGALDGVKRAQDALNEAQKGGDPKRIGDAQAALAKARKEAEKWKPTGDEMAAALEGVVSAAESTATALSKSDVTGERTRGTYELLVRSLEDLRNRGLIPSGKAYEDLLELYQLTPSDIDTRVNLNVEETRQNIQTITDQLEGIVGGEKAGAIKAEIQTLIDQGRWQDAYDKLESLPGVLDGEMAVVIATADELGIETTTAALDMTARQREALIRVDVDTAEAENQLQEFSRRVKDAWMRFGAGERVSMAELIGIRGSRADGGQVGPGWWLVGEEGPELLRMNGAGHVYDAQTSQRMLDSKSQSGAEFTQAQIDQLVDAIAARDGISVTVEGSGDGRITGLDIADQLWLRGR